MVAIPLDSPIWSRQASPTDALRLPHAPDEPRSTSPRILLDAAIKGIRTTLETHRSTIEKHEALYADRADHIGSEELNAFTDEIILDYIYQFGLCAEIAHDWSLGMEHEAKALREWRDATRCWSEDADRVLTELEKLATVFAHADSCFHSWADQLSDEYERRHPELAELPFQPLDLGPTNAARLPRVL